MAGHWKSFVQHCLFTDEELEAQKLKGLVQVHIANRSGPKPRCSAIQSSVISLQYIKFLGVCVGVHVYTHTYINTHTNTFPHTGESRCAFIILCILIATRPGKQVIYPHFYQWRSWSSKWGRENTQVQPGHCSKAGIQPSVLTPRPWTSQTPRCLGANCPGLLAMALMKEPGFPSIFIGKTSGSTAFHASKSQHFLFNLWEERE